jgi:colanic acid/amylovoran biosynthesis glycosyltransferase
MKALLTELVILTALKASMGPNGSLVLTQKYMNGAAEYALRWPGRVTTIASLTRQPNLDLDPVEVLPGSAVTGLEARPQDSAVLADRLESAAAVLAFLSPYELPIASLCAQRGVPIVFISEYSPKTERQIVDATTTNIIRRVRRKLWIDWAERRRRKMLTYSSGLQCSGTPTYELYSPHQKNSILFFDNRVSSADIISTPDLAKKTGDLEGGRPIRLVFGGRLVAMKGVLDLVPFAKKLCGLGVNFHLDIYGHGDLEGEIIKQIADANLQDRVKLRGTVDFQVDWIPLLKSRIDLFVCPHPQGDPSSTYPEVMSCGVPIVGYENDAFAGIIKHSNAGWSVPIHDINRLAEIVTRLDRNRSEITEMAQRAVMFARKHCLEETFSRRTKHLIKSSRLSPEEKARMQTSD